ncbi:MAG: cysteine synthase A [Oligoflexia bacterium]|nr:cysteine synthase A [Oligoflexia bacterium]
MVNTDTKVANNIIELIGKTPMVRLSRISNELKALIIAKLEMFNPMSSVKDRIALSMIEDAEKKGMLVNGSTIVEPTSGNTGIALAYICAVKGYNLILTMPDTMSVERRKLLKVFGAELVLTPGSKGMKGAVEQAESLVRENPDYVMLQQFNNPSNPLAHRRTTAIEIIESTDGNFDIFVSGVGTGGTITGVGEVIKKMKPEVKIYAVEPAASAVLSGAKPGPHKIQGIGAGFVPAVLNREFIDGIVTVTNEDAIAASKRLALKEGIFAGISSGAALHAAVQLASRDENRGKTIVVILPDSGERYLSTDLCDG